LRWSARVFTSASLGAAIEALQGARLGALAGDGLARMGPARWLPVLALALSQEESLGPLRSAVGAVDPVVLAANATAQIADAVDPAPAALAFNATHADFDAIDARAELLAPREGALLALDSFEVGINVFTPDPAEFEKHFADCRVCVRLDGGPWACWAVFEMTRPPLYAHVPSGAHELEAVLTDPRGDGTAILRRSWSGVRRFRVAGVEDLVAAEAPQEEPAAPAPVEDAAESTPMPRVQVDQPREMQPLPQAFEVGFGVESAEPERFRELFKHGHVCFDLTVSPPEDPEPDRGVPCWAVFDSTRKPLFAGLGDGFFTLRGWLLHPDSRQLVAPTASGLRALVTYASTTPQGEQREGPTAHDGDEAAGWARHFDAASNADYFHHAERGETQWSVPPRFPAPRRDGNASMVDLAITGEAWNDAAAVTRVVPVKHGTDAKVAATRICQGYGILNWHCVDELEKQIAAAAAADAASPAPAPAPPPPPPPPPPQAEVAEAPEAARPPPRAETPVQRLKQLKEAYEGGLIGEAAMERKRDEILAAM